MLEIFRNPSEELEMVLDGINDAITIVNKDAITMYWNSAAERIYGIKRKDIIGRSIREFFPSSLLYRILQENKSYENIYNSPRQNTYNIISATPLYKDDCVVGGISIDRDITDHIRTTELLNKAQTNLDVLQQQIIDINKNKSSFHAVLGNNPSFRDAIKLAKDVAHSNISILIEGESGTGKELFARAIHMESARDGHFVPINCSAIPNELIESELFGYSSGAFTGALKGGRAGKIELAHNGTLFLDEIGDMPINMQPKLLRVIEDGLVTKIGSEKGIKVSIRTIAATNKNLRDMVKKGLFRRDLYYRLNSVMIELPPLRNRKDDIVLIANRLVEDFCMEYGVNILSFEQEVMDALINHDWPGNVRELSNAIERMVVLAKNNQATSIDSSFLPNNISLKAASKGSRDKLRGYGYDLNLILAKVEKETIAKAMEKVGNNKAQAALLLNIPRSTLYFKLKKYNMGGVSAD